MLFKRVTYLCVSILFALTLTACGIDQAGSSSGSSNQPSTGQSRTSKPSNQRRTSSTRHPHAINVNEHYLVKTHFNNTPDWYVKHSRVVYNLTFFNRKNLINRASKDFGDGDGTVEMAENDANGINMKYADNKMYMIGWIYECAHAYMIIHGHYHSFNSMVTNKDERKNMSPSQNPADYRRAIALYKMGVAFGRQHHLQLITIGDDGYHHNVWENAKKIGPSKPNRIIPRNLFISRNY